MSNVPKEFTKSIVLRPDSSSLTIEGELKVDSGDSKLKVRVASDTKEVITDDQSQTITNKTIDADSNTLSNIDNADIKAGAAIARTKLASGTANRVVVNDGSGVVSDAAAITASRALISDSSGIPTHSPVTSTELGYVSGVTSAIQTQLDNKADASALTTHISDTSTHGISSNIVGESETQTLTNKTIDGDNNTVQDLALTSLKTNVTDASKFLVRDGSGIVVSNTKAVPSGVIVGTTDSQVLSGKTIDGDDNTVQDLPLTALKTNITDASKFVVRDASGIPVSNTKAVPAGVVVGTTDAQVLTAKDIDGGTASDTSRLTIPKASKATLDALTRKEATLVFASDEDKAYIDDGANLIPVGSGSGGGLDVFYSNDFSITTVSTFASGDNATFMGGGTLSGSLADETSNPIAGIRSPKYTQASGSLNDYFALADITLQDKQQGQTIGVRFPYTYDGASGDIAFIAYDVTNSTVLTSTLDTLTASTSISFFNTAFYIPASCTSLRVGFQVKVENSGKILVFDDIELSTNPFVYQSTLNLADAVDGGTITIGAVSSNPTKGTIVQDKVYYSRVGQRMLANYKYEQSAAGALGSGDYLFTLPGGYQFDSNLVTFFTGSLYNSANSQQAARSFVGNGGIAVGSGSGYTGTVSLYAYDATRFRAVSDYGNGIGSGGNNSLIGSAGYFTLDLARVAYGFRIDAPISGWSGSNLNVVTPQIGDDSNISLYTQNGFGSTATKIRRFTNIRTSVGTAVTYADSATDGATFTINQSRNYTITYTETVSAISTIGISRNSSATTTNISSVTEADVLAKETVSLTGYSQSCSWTGWLNKDDVIRPHTNGDTATFATFSIAAVGFKSLSAVPVQQVAYLKDVKSSGTDGGTFTSGSWQTRTLNTIEGDSTIVSLSSNQFILGPGLYNIEAFAPGLGCYEHKAKLRNITSSADSIIGSSERAENTDGTNTVSVVMGALTLTASTTFELQHRCLSTRATIGFGKNSGLSVSEIYAQVKITKLR